MVYYLFWGPGILNIRIGAGMVVVVCSPLISGGARRLAPLHIVQFIPIILITPLGCLRMYYYSCTSVISKFCGEAASYKG